MSHSLRARYVFPVSRPPICDGFVTIDDGRIIDVGPAEQAPRDARDLGRVALLPGLINAHTHLELAPCPAPLGAPGMRLPEWIALVMAHRAEDHRKPTEAVKTGLHESLRAGTAAIGDIVQPGLDTGVHTGPPLCGVRFLELIAPTEDRVESALAAARQFLDSPTADAGWQPGLSPHAPYTVRPELLDWLIETSADEKVPLAMHLAESPEEIELLDRGTGPMRELLERLGAWQPGLVRTGSRPLDYLRRLADAHRALIVHGNLLDTDEIMFLADRADRMSVAYCPRTHARFRHPPYPLREMLAAGVNVCLGTDSRASSPDLSVWPEMVAAQTHLAAGLAPRFSNGAAPLQPDWVNARAAADAPPHPAADALEMATLAGARALGLEGELGQIAPGRRAALIAIALPEAVAVETDPYELSIFRIPWPDIRPIPVDEDC